MDGCATGLGLSLNVFKKSSSLKRFLFPLELKAFKKSSGFPYVYCGFSANVLRKSKSSCFVLFPNGSVFIKFAIINKLLTFN